jgi:predicted signal transduction protein with EAL and GGDEF domain
MTNYTPGPWSWRKTSQPDNHDDGRHFHWWRLGNDRGGRVGMVDHINHDDAALIAESPALLEALRAICDSWEQTGDVGVHLFAAGRDAVTRAERGAKG